MRKLGHFFMVIFFHLKIVFNFFQVLINIFSSLGKGQRVDVELAAAFKQDGKTKLVYKTKGVFFAYIVGYGFIDNQEGDVFLPFSNKSVRVIFFGLKSKFKKVEVNQSPYKIPFAFTKNVYPSIDLNRQPKLVNKLSFKPINLPSHE